MASPQDIRIAIKGAGKLARFDRSGLALLGNTPDDAWRSFHAAILVGPFFLIWLALNGFEVAHGSFSMV